jgi:hypothetical protein
MSSRLRWLITMVGFVGLLLDVSFHWVSAIYDQPIPVEVPLTTVLQQLLIDVDPANVPLWVTLLGMTAHAMFLGGFLLLVGLGMYDYKRSLVYRGTPRRRTDS